MRSRYTAYTKGDIDYIKNTLAPESVHDFDMVATKKWSQQSKWLGLKIHAASGGVNDKQGKVEFTATYNNKKENLEHHEVSEFRKDENGRWLFVTGDGHTHREGEGHDHHTTKVETVVRQEPKVGRNDACPCGSGKKYKKCCAA
ncbi:MAG: SEC-C domain-containing protein [Bdellovibrionaceae bacterium]|nr:SEC-C domain-containing protein [Pseudobdellovibrionaceae bacterium]